MGKSIALQSAGAVRIGAYRADPAGKPRGGLVVVQEIFGVNSHIRAVCDGYAAEGYLAVAPALFDRIESGIELGYTASDIAKARGLRSRSDVDAALADLAAARDVAAEAGKVGIVGYCWGGYLAWLAAARLPGFTRDRLLRRRHARGSRRNAEGAGLGTLRAQGRDDPGGRDRSTRQSAPRADGALLRRRPRFQLRPARLVSRRVGDARARAHARLLASARGLTSSEVSSGCFWTEGGG